MESYPRNGAVALFLLLLALIVLETVQAQVNCYSQQQCGGPATVVNTTRECCLTRDGVTLADGLSYNQTGEECQTCVVFGWRNEFSFEASEQDNPYRLEVGYLKGANRAPGDGRLQFNVRVTEGTARDNDDYRVGNTQDLDIQPNETHIIGVRFLSDNVALEPDETLTLTLVPRNQLAMAQDSNVFLLETIQLTIMDSDSVRFQFTESEYITREEEGTVQVMVERNRRIATDVTLRITPVNYTEVNFTGFPFPEDFPDVPEFDPTRPIIAKSLPEDARDFNITPIEITFCRDETDNSEDISAPIAVFNDVVMEADEVFVVLLEVVSNVPLAQVNLQNRNASLCRILDDDQTVQAQVNCYSQQQCGGPATVVSTIRECCLTRDGVTIADGLSYNQTGEECQTCVVFGWRNGFSFEASEQDDPYRMEVGYLKGANGAPGDGRLQFNVRDTEGTASDNDDYRVGNTQNLDIQPNETHIIGVLFQRDNVALEPDETLELTLVPRNQLAMAQDSNIFLLQTIQLTIMDSDVVRFQFTESEYITREEEGTVWVMVERNLSIATDVTLRITPVNYTEVNVTGFPFPEDFPDVPEFDPTRPIIANSLPEDARDFNITPIEITFHSDENDNSEDISAHIAIFNDAVNEADEVFVVLLEVVSDVPLTGVNLQNRNASLCRIFDDDLTTTSQAAPMQDSGSMDTTIIVIVVTVGVLVILVFVAGIPLLILFIKRKQVISKHRGPLGTTVDDTPLPTLEETDMKERAQNAYTYTVEPALMSTLEESTMKKVSAEMVIPCKTIQLHNSIGQGEFGIVYKAHILGSQCRRAVDVVAVKTLKGFFDHCQVNELMRESLKMMEFDHPNVLNLIGVCLDGGPAPYLVMPFMANGSLLCYLKRERPNFLLGEEADEEQVSAVSKRLLDICIQIAKGMEYLATMKLVHRDLAARNCMIDLHFVIKVADFGLCESTCAKTYFRQGQQGVKLPLKWLAPECLTDGVFSEKSDVWAYGVTCWEIYSAGKIPYPGVDPASLLGQLECGERLEKPNNAAVCEEIYSVMLSCWNSNPEERPPFSELVTKVSGILDPLAGYMDFTSFARRNSMRFATFRCNTEVDTLETDSETSTKSFTLPRTTEDLTEMETELDVETLTVEIDLETLSDEDESQATGNQVHDQ